VTPAMYEDKIARLERELLLRREQLSEYFGIVGELEELRKDGDKKEKQITELTEKVERLLADRARVQDENATLQTVVDKYEEKEEKESEYRDEEIEELRDQIRRYEEDFHFSEVLRERMWEILNDQVSGNWPLGEYYGCFNGVPKTWEEMLAMMREYVWSHK
jgi:chromatin segregation and condensation protein Rec8/ScpA/Scc1 (kleisin family)